MLKTTRDYRVRKHMEDFNLVHQYSQNNRSAWDKSVAKDHQHRKTIAEYYLSILKRMNVELEELLTEAK